MRTKERGRVYYHPGDVEALRGLAAGAERVTAMELIRRRAELLAADHDGLRAERSGGIAPEAGTPSSRAFRPEVPMNTEGEIRC